MNTPSSGDRLRLADETDHGLAEWEEAAAAVLRKARRLGDDDPDDAVWDALASTTLDGFRISPLGTPSLVADLAEPVRPPARGAGWDVRALLADPDAQRAKAAATTDLENGATSLWLTLGDAGTAVDDLPAVLADVMLDLAPVVLEAPRDPLGAARAFADLARGTDLAAGTNLGVDPLGVQVRDGASGSADDDRGVLLDAAELAEELGCTAVVVDGTPVHDLGGSDAQELGYVLAAGAAYLRLLTASGRDVADAAALLELRLAATDRQLETVAKLRAVRRGWARVLELSGVAAHARQARVHAVTSRPMMTRHDPWVNMLRTTVAAFAAGVGGADAVTVLPFDSRLGLPDAFGRRIARNTSTLLVEEAHVAQVADPAGGAWAVERLTHDLAEAGWAELGRIEEAGGVLAALADGSLRERVDAVVAERDRRVGDRSLPITGVSEFPNSHEQLPEREAAPGSFPVRSYAQPYEALRDDPATTPVFLATMGPLAAHTTRSTFATNVLAAGGVDVAGGGAHADVDAVLADYRDDPTPVVCLVGHDRDYAAWGSDLVTALRDAGARWVLLAGAPDGDLAQQVDDSCARGVDALAFLRRTREQLEAAR